MASRFTQKDIVLVPFPFTHFDSEKVRPSLILSPRNSHDDYVVLFLTTQIKKYGAHNENVYIKKNEDNNLALDSVVICSKIATISENMIHEKIGEISNAEWAQIKKSVKAILNL